jgi:hypothetical protein
MLTFGKHLGRPAVEELRETRNPAFIQVVEVHAALLGQRPSAA